MTKAFLLVEDEMLIRMMVADMIEELGHVVAAEAGTIDKAMSYAATSAFDIAILDVNLDGSEVTPVAEILAKRRIPFLFASGYGSGGIPQSFSDRPVLRKPFQLEQLERTVRSLLSATDETVA
jgi:CheY-like chemotaxis protein